MSSAEKTTYAQENTKNVNDDSQKQKEHMQELLDYFKYEFGDWLFLHD